MSIIYVYIMAMAMLLGGSRGHTDLLDAVGADIYWQLKGVTPGLVQLEKDAGPDAAPASLDDVVKRLQSDDFQTRDKARQELERMGPGILGQLGPLVNSPDSEVAAVAGDLQKRFLEHEKERAIRRLMAIRTLGERREKDALPLLNGLRESNEMFVADYARRAIAQINGEKVEFADPAAAMERDLALLPADTALVSQSRGIAPEQLTIAAIVDRGIAAAAHPPAGMPAPELPDRKSMVLEGSKKVLAIVENVGNIEIDGMTVGFTINKDDDGWGAIILHGKYDSARVYAAAKKAMADEATPDGEKPAEKPSDIPCLDIEHGEIQVLFPDNERVVVTAGPREKAAKIRDTFVASLKRGNGGLAGNKELGGLIKTVDTHSPVWIAAKLTETMQTDIFAGFKTIAMDSKPTREGVSFTFRGTGGDEKEVTAAVERMDGGIKAGLASAQAEVADNPTLKPAADFMASLKLSRDGKSATLTGEIKAQVLDSMLGELGLLSQMIVRPAPPVIIEDPVPVVPK